MEARLCDMYFYVLYLLSPNQQELFFRLVAKICQQKMLLNALLVDWNSSRNDFLIPCSCLINHWKKVWSEIQRSCMGLLWQWNQSDLFHCFYALCWKGEEKASIYGHSNCSCSFGTVCHFFATFHRRPNTFGNRNYLDYIKFIEKITNCS